MSVRVIALRRPDACNACGTSVAAGTRAQWDASARSVTCLPCAETPQQAADISQPEAAVEAARSPAPPGAGGSRDVAATAAGAMRDRLPAQAVMEQVLRLQGTMRPRGRLARLFGVSPLHPDSTAWYAGATGELRVAELLAQLPAPWTVLHSLPIGNKDTDIDHLIVGPSGVFTINTKRHPGKRVWVGGQTVMVNGHRQPYVRKAEAEGRQVRALLSRRCPVPTPVRPLIAVVGAQSVIVRTPPHEVAVLSAERLPGWLQRQPPILDAGAMRAVADVLDRPDVWRPAIAMDAAAALQFMTLRDEVATARRRRLLWLLALVPGLLILAPALMALLLVMAAAATRL